MKHLFTNMVLVAMALGTVACSDQRGLAVKSDAGLVQLSAVRWDEVAAASSAAHVQNNGLIMMR